MPRRYRRRASNGDALYIALTLVIAMLWVHPRWLTYVTYGLGLVLGVGLVGLAYRLYVRQKWLSSVATLADVDAMDGLEFEDYIVNLLKHHGFMRVHRTEKYDLGVDIVAEKEGERWGVQVKRYDPKRPVKADAVRQATTGLKAYHCTKPMVITNSTYTRYAKRLAKSCDCVLVDRKRLVKLIGTASSPST